MSTEEKQLQELKLEDEHSKSLEVCRLLTEGTSLKSALSMLKLPPAVFYRARRDHQDVAKAWEEAQEMLAELKLSDMNELGARLIDEEGLTAGTYTAVTKNDRWIIEKLNPERYGARPTATTASLVQNNVQILHTLSDEQILAIANGTQVLPAREKTVKAENIIPADKKVLDNAIDAEYTEDIENVVSDVPLKEQVPYNSQKSSQVATTTPVSSKKAGGCSYDLSAFGDLL